MAALTAATNVAGSMVRTDTPAQNTNSDASSIIVVEFLGFGGGDGEAPPPQRDQDGRDRKTSGSRNYDPSGPVQILGHGELTDQESNS